MFNANVSVIPYSQHSQLMTGKLVVLNVVPYPLLQLLTSTVYLHYKAVLALYPDSFTWVGKKSLVNTVCTCTKYSTIMFTQAGCRCDACDAQMLINVESNVRVRGTDNS